MGTTMVLHKGAREVTRVEVEAVPTPPCTDTHFPIPFGSVLDMTLSNLKAHGFEPTRQRLALHGENRFFATIDLRSTLAPGITVAAALRSSHDRSLPYGMVMGNRVFCCDNLSLTSDLSRMIRVKHTRFGQNRFDSSMNRLVKTLPQFMENETARIKRFQLTDISDTDAESLILRSHEKGIVSYKHLLPVLKEYRSPSFEEFTDTRSLWRLENAFTTVLGFIAQSSPGRYSKMCIGLQGLLATKAPAAEVSIAVAA